MKNEKIEKQGIDGKRLKAGWNEAYCRAYFPAQVHPDLKYLFIRRRQLMIDLVLVGHGFTDIPPKYYTNSSKYILFKTVDNIASRKQVLSRFDELKQAQARINKKAETNPYYKEVINI